MCMICALHNNDAKYAQKYPREEEVKGYMYLLQKKKYMRIERHNENISGAAAVVDICQTILLLRAK